MTQPRSPLPTDVAALQAMVVARDHMIEALKLTIAKLQHARHGASSERGRKLLDQLELQLAELQECIAEEEAAAELAAPSAEPSSTQDENGQTKPARRPLPEHLARERIVHAAPAACPCCGGNLRKLGEDVTERRLLAAIRQASRRSNMSRRAGRSSSMCGRSSPAGSVRPSRRRRRRSIRSPAAAPDPSSWRKSCSPNTARICR
jgi:hypothetical protein